MLRIMIAERRKPYADVWKRLSKGRDDVVIVEGTREVLCIDPTQDAALVPSRFGHENFGGFPQLGRSAVLSARAKPGICPWLVTTPLMVTAEYDALSRSDATLLDFSRIFDAIGDFNRTSTEPIRTLGVDPELVGFCDDDYELEVKAVLKALDTLPQAT